MVQAGPFLGRAVVLYPGVIALDDVHVVAQDHQGGDDRQQDERRHGKAVADQPPEGV